MKVVISVGGSLLTRKLNAKNYKKYANVLLKLWKKGHKVAVVCGAGRLKKYIKIARELGADSRLQDCIGIDGTHINAKILASVLKDKCHLIGLQKEKDAIKEVKRWFGKKILVCGGYEPGHSTDYDAAIFAEVVKADLVINASNVSGVYAVDPKRKVFAKKFDRLSHKEFLKIIRKNPQIPGEYRLFDLPGAKVLAKSNIKLIMISGKDPKEIIRAVQGKHKGTVVEG
jgi:uridylate kinase